MNLKQLGKVINNVNKGKSVHIKTGSVKKARKLVKLLETTLEPYMYDILIYVLLDFHTDGGTSFNESDTVIVTKDFGAKIYKMKVS